MASKCTNARWPFESRGNKKVRRRRYSPEGSKDEGTMTVSISLPCTYFSQSPFRPTTVREEFEPAWAMISSLTLKNVLRNAAVYFNNVVDYFRATGSATFRRDRKDCEGWLLTIQLAPQPYQARPFDGNGQQQNLILLRGYIFHKHQRSLRLGHYGVESTATPDHLRLRDLVAVAQRDLAFLAVGEFNGVAADAVSI